METRVITTSRRGFTPRLLRPDEEGELLSIGLGIMSDSHLVTPALLSETSAASGLHLFELSILKVHRH